MQVELMRHQIKAAENQREIDLERMQAQNKGKAKPLFRNYCPMCNINFYGPLTGHRKSDRHRVSTKLNKYLSTVHQLKYCIFVTSYKKC